MGASAVADRAVEVPSQYEAAGESAEQSLEEEASGTGIKVGDEAERRHGRDF
jgi:hypothetical protein